MQGIRFSFTGRRRRDKVKVQEFKINLGQYEALVKVEEKGFLRKKRKVEYYLDLPRDLRREAYNILTKQSLKSLRRGVLSSTYICPLLSDFDEVNGPVNLSVLDSLSC
jgi:hypothetical protein